MVNALITSRSFKGLVPGLDRRQVGQAFIADGRNFLLDAEGPYSGFGNEWATYELLRSIVNVATFRVEGDIFLFTEDAVFIYNEEAQKYIPVFVFEIIFPAISPWTGAIVGGKYYFSRSGVNVLQYNPFTQAWKEIITDVVNSPASVTSSAGRLVIEGATEVQWSALDDGENLASSTVTGAGRQSLAIVGNGAPLKALKTNDGFISYTTSGLMKSEFIDSINPFRHYPLSITENNVRSKDIPVDAFNVIEIDQGRHIILSENGLRITDGRKPIEWDPLFNEFLRRQIFTRLDFTRNEHITSLYYDSAREWVLFSISLNQVEHIFSQAWVKYVPVDEWGIFNREHTAFGEFALRDRTIKAFNFGYIGSDGCVHRFNDFPQQEFAPPFNELFYVHESYEFPARLENDKVAFPSVMNIRSIDKALFPEASGLYYQNTYEVFPGNYGSIDAYIDVAAFRYNDEEHVDEMAIINNVSIGMIEQPETQEFEDYMAGEFEVFEDWLDPPDTFEDWGTDIFSGVNYDAILIGTLDGYTIYQDQQEDLQEINPSQIGPNERDRVRLFDAYTSGIYFISRINAREERQSFHLKFLELSGMLIGRV